MRPQRVRYVAIALCLLIVAGCESPKPIPPTGGPNTQPTSGPLDSSGNPTTTEGPTSSEGPSARVPLPQDIVGAIDAIIDAPSSEAAIAATRAVLERSGVVVSDDPATAPKSMAGIYVGTEQLAVMAYEAQSRATLSHVAFTEFADTFGGLALLPPNDALLDATDATESVDLDLDGQSLRLAAFLTSWVNRSLAIYPNDDPVVIALTAPALYLAELASRQGDSIELRKPFSPSRLDLGALDITLLVAGIRTTLAVSAQQTASLSSVALASTARGREAGAIGLAVPGIPDCAAVKAIIDGHVPLITDVYSFGAGEMIKGFAEIALTELFNRTGSVTKYVGAAFEALGVLFRVLALWLLFNKTEVNLTLEPTTIHKSVAGEGLITAQYSAGISDADWAKALADRANSPTLARLRDCARALGVPMWTDTIDLGAATTTWRAAWEVKRGGEHARPDQCQFLMSCDPQAVATGRSERRLARRDDHSGQDIVSFLVQAEMESDHPGQMVETPIEVCAHLRTDSPPDLATLLNAGSAGVSGVTIGGAASLASSAANILLTWWQFVFTIDKCAETTVSFHVPQPGNWHGTVKVNSASHQSSQVHNSKFTGRYRTTVEITDTYYVSGDDHGQKSFGGMPVFVMLDARQYTRGGYVQEDAERALTSTFSGCNYFADRTFEMDGTWNYDGVVQGGMLLQLDADGHYQLNVSRFYSDQGATLPTLERTAQIDRGSDKSCLFGDSTKEGTRLVREDDVLMGAILINGDVDLSTPTLALTGRVTIPNPDAPWAFITVEWNLTRAEDPKPIGQE